MEKVTIYGLMLLLSFSCSRNEIIHEEPKTEDGTLDAISLESAFWNPKQEDSKVCENLGKYEDFFVNTDYISLVSSAKLTPIDEEHFFVYNFQKDAGMLTKSFEEFPEISVRIDGEAINTYSGYLCTKGDNSNKDVSSLFGRNITFSIGSITKSGASNADVDLYIPELIQITSPVVEKENEMFPLCYYDGFVLKWNADMKNDNGVVVVVEWFGTMVFGNDHPDAYVRHADFVPDNGETVLNGELFEGIPDTALCHLTIYRGDLENIIIDDASHKIVGETHASLPFILIKEMK